MDILQRRDVTERGRGADWNEERERDIRCEGNWQPSSTQESFLDQCGTLSPCHCTEM
jgi:hypothetical protein